MKTLKITAAISLFFFLIGMTSVFSTPAGKLTSSFSNAGIRYQVNVQFNHDMHLCNFYQVVVVNESGKLIAPPQTFRQGTTAYYFVEAGPVSGTRIAMLIINPDIMHFICPNELFTSPDMKRGEFLTGRTYDFNLYPQTQGDQQIRTNQPPKE